jgi:D-amino-acid dehydrogenase
VRIAVIGAGIIGVTTAYELATDGHAVTVFERHGAAAEETSFANAGVVAPGYVTPWAAPGMAGKVLRSLFARHGAVKLAWPLTPQELGWMWRWARACRLDTYLANRARMQRLAFFSRERLHWLVDSMQLSFDRSPGYVVLLRGEKERRLVEPGLQVLREAGVSFREIDPAATRALEPGLHPETPFLGAIHLPDDEAGNCRQFALLLKDAARAAGAQFAFNAAVEPLDPAAPAVLRVRHAGEEDPREERYDAVVVCAGVESARLLRPVGIRLPIVPVWGYSVSAPIHEPLHAPRSALMDERYKVAITRLGRRVRVAGSAEIGGSAGHKRQAALQTLYRVLQDWFPGATQLSNRCVAAQEWKGARPMLPDGPPVLGASGVPGVWLNLGHGSSGWALACGSARVVADLMGGRAPLVDLEGLGIERLQG